MDRLRKLRPKAMWVKNYYGGSDLYSPTMNGDVRTVIQGCPTLWFREVAGYPNHVACMEFNELSAVVSRENWQIAVDRVYAADERLRVGDPDRKQYRLLGPLERPEQEGPWKLEVPKIIRPSIEELPGPNDWLYRRDSKIPSPVRGSNRKSHISKPAECKEEERSYTGLTRQRVSKPSNQSRKLLPATSSRRLPALQHEIVQMSKQRVFIKSAPGISLEPKSIGRRIR